MSSITVGAEPYAAAHPEARRLCAANRCVPITARSPGGPSATGDGGPGISLPYDGEPIRLRVIVTTADGVALVNRPVTAKAHRVGPKGCPAITYEGSVTVTRDGSVRTS
ncbi:hypothetical protein [Actinomadura atramentaria]|uniref:hypothetical protein n=1 Tax=Actinomadura atramentaria TaxID=1990 RepID=UPI00039BF920|nr:hypothetical protein [Actinomadura atramentaria]